MQPLSENAIRLLGEAGQSGDGPGRLHRAWAGGELDDDDLSGLISQIWTHTDNAEQTIGTDAWLAMFRAAGPIVVPTTRSLPSQPLLAYRGTVEERKYGTPASSCIRWRSASIWLLVVTGVVYRPQWRLVWA
jgi:hypothetical protein